MFVESVCEETGNMEIKAQERAQALLRDAGKLEMCA
jgi:hypothetical protein